MYHLDPLPGHEAISHVYRPGYYTGVNAGGYRKNVLKQEEKQLQRAEVRLERIRRYKTSGRLFDVGCGPGFFLHVASQHFEVAGSDISPEAKEFAATRFGLDFPLRDFCSVDLPPNYDVITMFSVLEHMLDPLLGLSKAYSALRRDGLLALSLPNIESLPRYLLGRRWRGFSFPEHLYFFSGRKMRELLTQTGFEVIDPPWRENNFFRDTVYFYARKPKSESE